MSEACRMVDAPADSATDVGERKPMTVRKAVWRFLRGTVRVAMYPVSLALRIVMRLLLLVATVAPVGSLVLVLGIFLEEAGGWERIFECLERLRGTPFGRVAVGLIATGVFAGILKILGKYIYDQFQTLLTLLWDVLRKGWIPSWRIGKALAVTWRCNIAKIPRNIWQSTKSGWALMIAVFAGTLLALFTYVLLDQQLEASRDAANDVGQETRQQTKLDMRSGRVSVPMNGVAYEAMLD